MTLQEVLDTIKMKYNHSYSNDQVVTMLNNIQTRLFRTLYKPETATIFDIIADNPFYPVDFPPENIFDVVVNGSEYPKQNIKYQSYNRYYYITEDNCIGLYPTPTEDITDGLTVFRYMDPDTLSASNLGSIPSLDPAWHMLLVYHVCRELAVIDKNDLFQVFATEITDLEKQFHKSNRSSPHPIMDVYGIGRGAW